ncbi:MAG: hypothetical protein ACI8Q9_001610 [Planctomycetota bacterium]
MQRPQTKPKVWVLNLDAEQELSTRGSYTAPSALKRIVARQRLPLLGSLVAPGDYVVLDDLEAGKGAPPQAAGTSEGERERAGAPSGAKPGRVLRLDPGLDAERALASETLAAQDAASLARHLQPVLDTGVLRNLPGHAWSPTPNALGLLRRFGAVVAPAPGLDILRQVNARSFAAQLHAQLALDPGTLTKHVASSLGEALAALGQPAPLGWLVRRSFGAAGRGRMRIASLDSHRLTAAEQSWLVASLAIGPLVLEPWVEVTQEFTRSAWLGTDGSVSISAPCLQGTNDAGAWSGSRRISTTEVARADDDALGAAMESAGRALHQAGYSGPFGIDAFRHRTGPGATALNPMSEINARFTMDWTCAMGEGPASAVVVEPSDSTLANAQPAPTQAPKSPRTTP